MIEARETWQTQETDELLDAIVDLRDRDEAARFLRDLCTLGELHDLAQRWQVVRLLAEGLHYGEVARRSGASTATVTRIAGWLHHGMGGYRQALERRAARRGEPLPSLIGGGPIGRSPGVAGGGVSAAVGVEAAQS
ncbi:MAG: YerC/YecD family TrpR-related protein [Candidatus Limnocylindrales bacterium]